MRRTATALVVAAAWLALVAPGASAQDDTATTTTSTTTTTITPSAAAPMPTAAAETPPPAAVAPEPVTAAAPATAATEQQQGDNCNSNYGPSPNGNPCIPNSTEDINCTGTPYDGGSYPVTGTDVYGLDGNDNDRIACEADTGATATPAPTSPAATTPPASDPPATVAGATATNTGQLAQTGSTSGPLALLAVGLILAGLVVGGLSAAVADPLRGRIRGGYRVNAVDRHGDPFTYTVAPVRRR